MIAFGSVLNTIWLITMLVTIVVATLKMSMDGSSTPADMYGLVSASIIWTWYLEQPRR